MFEEEAEEKTEVDLRSVQSANPALRAARVPERVPEAVHETFHRRMPPEFVAVISSWASQPRAEGSFVPPELSPSAAAGSVSFIDNSDVGTNCTSSDHHHSSNSPSLNRFASNYWSERAGGARKKQLRAGPVGVCYGRNGDNLPTPLQAVASLRAKGITKVRIFDADASVLQAFADSGIAVSITVSNLDLTGIALDQGVSDAWVLNNVLPYVPATSISSIAVGTEVMMTNAGNLSSFLVPAMRNIFTSLKTNNLDSAIQTRSPFMLNSYPYYAYVNDPKGVPLEYALFTSTVGVIDSNNQLHYTNLFDAQVDAVKGDSTENAASVKNAQTYNQNLKADPESERNFGILYADGTEVYTLNFYGGADGGFQSNMDPRACNFSGTANLTQRDPSYGNCVFYSKLPSSGYLQSPQAYYGFTAMLALVFLLLFRG
ncbi:hypothetical protein AXG93_2789s1080 [Marchantia polymorpha subsp. ruderalis]|uniref:Glucan endo-1,3-beta-D-glucosidase n=1 Tax=Marchantia polymorpha subsp. ruderalis TaxID=1480154 RepID=A0A176W7X0_MARPO|nr:hypothetical protein AXG93_2789s1080 [Marchantia polymorpha subsp. ruderalis]